MSGTDTRGIGGIEDARTWLIDCTNISRTAKYLCLHLRNIPHLARDRINGNVRNSPGLSIYGLPSRKYYKARGGGLVQS